MASLEKISKQLLPQLKQIYRINWPLHAVAYVAIDHFINRFEKKPEWEGKVKFWALEGDDWQQSGTFVMVNENDQHVLFDTLEPSPYKTLHKTLQLLDYNDEKVFVCFRDILRPVVLDVIRIRNLEITFDNGTRCMYTPLKVNDVILDPPEGFRFASLRPEHVPQINEIWPQRSSRSLQFLMTIVTENPSTGLFDSKTGELAAWCIQLETGAIGNLQVNEKYYRRGLGESTVIEQRLKMSRELNCEIVGHIAHQNEASFGLTLKYGTLWIDNSSWIGVRKREPLKLIPLWSRL